MRRLAGSRLALVLAFVAVHVWLTVINLFWAPGGMTDVSGVYRRWVEHGLATGTWVGIDEPWVYPIAALAPLVLAGLPGIAFYPPTWFVMVGVLDLVALGFVIGWRRRAPGGLAAGWAWTGYLLALGPIAASRIDSVTVPIVIVGLVLLARRPAVASAVLTVAVWIKVWPVAVLGAVLIAVRRRWAVILGAVAASAVIVGVGLALGAGANLLSFVGQQTARGLQIEAPVSTLWLWLAAVGTPGTRVYFDTQLITYQVLGHGVQAASSLMNPLLAVAVVVVVLLGIRAAHRGAATADLLPLLMLAFITCLIVFNKVGSPQYIAWLAAPLVVVFLAGPVARQRFRLPFRALVAIAIMTQFIFPYLYFLILQLHPAMLVVLSIRNLLLIAVFVWSLIGLARSGPVRAGPTGGSVRERIGADPSLER